MKKKFWKQKKCWAKKRKRWKSIDEDNTLKLEKNCWAKKENVEKNVDIRKKMLTKKLVLFLLDKKIIKKIGPFSIR